MNFGTDTIIDFLNIGRCFTTLVVLYTQQVGVSQPLWYCILCRADWCFTTLVILYILSRYMFHNPCGTVYSAGWCFTTLDRVDRGEIFCRLQSPMNLKVGTVGNQNSLPSKQKKFHDNPFTRKNLTEELRMKIFQPIRNALDVFRFRLFLVYFQTIMYTLQEISCNFNIF